MANRSLALQLDEVVQAMLVSLQPRREKTPDRELASLARVAQELRDLPREEFRTALKCDLQRRASTRESTAAGKAGTEEEQVGRDHYMRLGLTSITPHVLVVGASEL